MEKNTLSFDETREALGGISRPTLWRRVASGEITPLPRPRGLKKRSHVEFSRDEVQRFLAVREHEEERHVASVA